MSTLTVEQILLGSSLGRMQTVGTMSVIPLIDQGDSDESYEAPDLEVSTSDYGTVELRHRGELPTIVPTGAGWVVDEAAQDHAIASAAFMGAGAERTIETAMCIQQTQGGYIKSSAHKMLILPAALRSYALARRHEKGYSKLWEDIGAFNESYGIDRGSGGAHLEYFLRQFSKELDEFVAEFELVPEQVGAIVLIAGQLAGIERAPNVAFWSSIWEPLVRVCYGSLAIKASRSELPPAERFSLQVTQNSIEGIRAALVGARAQEDAFMAQTFDRLCKTQLQANSPEEQQGDAHLVTLASPELAGQVVLKGVKAPYVSLCSSI
jgi:hypothetical protein